MASRILYRVKALKEICHRGVWYYEGDVFASDAKDLDQNLVEVEKIGAKVSERGEAGTVPHFVPETTKEKTKPARAGSEE